MDPLRTLLVDDHKEFRICLREFLETREDVKVIGEAEDGFEAILVTKTSHPDLIFMDISMPNFDGLSAAREIKKEFPETAIAVVSLYDQDKYRELAKSIGIEEFLGKGSLVRDIPRALKAIRETIAMRKNRLNKGKNT